MNQSVATKAGRVVRLLPVIVVPALLASACASGTGRSATTGSTTSTSPSTAASLSVGTGQGNGADQGGGTAAQATPTAALAHYLTQILSGDYSPVCQEMAGIASTSTSAPSPFPTAECVSSLKDLHSNFAADGLTPKNSFTVDSVDASGSSVTVDGTKIHVAGTTLTALMTAHSTGVHSGQFNISFEVTRINNAWYVTNMNMNIG